MGFSLDINVPIIMVFFQGLISFLSPCVLPLIPLYIGYLSGGTGVKGEDGKIYYKKSKVMLNTFCFVVGVSFAFFSLGLGFSAMGSFFKDNQMLFAKIGGVIIVLFGLYQLGLFGKSMLLSKERRFNFNPDKFIMSPVSALIMGFTFSFAWTPCVGPALTSALIMAASASTKASGFMLIGVYTAGFVLPFLAVGFFTTSLLGFFKNHMDIVKYTAKVGGILMILMGVLMFTGKMNDVTGYLSSISSPFGTENSSDENNEKAGDESSIVTENEETEVITEENTADDNGDEEDIIPAIDFTLTDQYGKTHKLSDYKGKTVFLNFWATWCPPCKAEMPDIQRIYESYDTDGDDALIVLGVAAPNMGREKSEEEIKSFLEQNGYTYPVVMDRTGEIFNYYGITSFPTTFMIDRDGNVFGYVSGQLNEEIMHSIIKQTMEGKRE